MTPLIWEPAAVLELRNAMAASRQPAKFQGVVDRVIGRIIADPRIAPVVGRSRLVRRYILPKRFPYSIVYADEPTLIRVVAFAHHKQKPGYWKARLSP